MSGTTFEQHERHNRQSIHDAEAAKMVAGGTCPSEGAAAAPANVTTPAAALFAGHVLRDGELVVLLLRPSRWFILLSGIKFLAAVAILIILGAIFSDKLPYSLTHNRVIEAGVFLAAGRIVWAILQWMGRLYILTDLRILALSGVFSIEVFDCPLRRVARTLLEASVKERLCRIGSITIVPQDEDLPLGSWRMVARPRHVHEKVLAMIAKAKQGGSSA